MQKDASSPQTDLGPGGSGRSVATEALFRAFMDNSPAVAFMKDEAGRFVYVNKPYERLFGTTLAERHGKTDFDFRPAEIARALRHHDTKVLSTNTTLETFESVPAPDGSLHSWRVFKFPVVDAAGRRLLGGMAVDVTERKRAEEALHEAQARFRIMADSIPVLLWTSGPDGRCTFVNQSWLRFTGRTLEEELGEGWVESIHPDDRAHCLALYHSAFAARAKFELEYRLRRADGEYCWILDQGAPRLLPDGSFNGYIGSGMEISDRKRAEAELHEMQRRNAQRERLADIGAITAKVVHDFGNPLAGVSMQVQLLLRRLDRGAPGPEAFRRPAEQILSTVHRLESMVREFMAAAREPQLQLNAVHLPRLLQETIDLWRPVGRARDITVGLETDDVGDIRADAAQLRRVFDNLIKNAIEAIDLGPGEVTIHVAVLTPESVRVSVEDTGPGVPERVELFRLFETTKADGTGLGLPVAKQIIQAHGGSIHHVRRVPHGAVFHLDIPRQGPPSSIKRDWADSADNYCI